MGIEQGVILSFSIKQEVQMIEARDIYIYKYTKKEVKDEVRVRRLCKSEWKVFK